MERAAEITRRVLFYAAGGAAQHHELKRVARDSGTSTPSSANGFDGRISLSDDNSSSGQGNDGLERNVSAPNDALHLERRVSNWTISSVCARAIRTRSTCPQCARSRDEDRCVLDRQ